MHSSLPSVLPIICTCSPSAEFINLPYELNLLVDLLINLLGYDHSVYYHPSYGPISRQRDLTKHLTNPHFHYIQAFVFSISIDVAFSFITFAEATFPYNLISY